MKIKTNEYGNMSIVGYKFVTEHKLCYTDTIYNKKLGDIDIYENENGQKYAVVVNDWDRLLWTVNI